MQHGTCDCGLFAIATDTALVHGIKPGSCLFKQNEMREHLYNPVVVQLWCSRAFPCCCGAALFLLLWAVELLAQLSFVEAVMARSVFSTWCTFFFFAVELFV